MELFNIIIAFVLGIIIGLLIRVYQYNPEKIKEIKQLIPFAKEKTQFLEPVSPQERFDKSNNITEFLE